MVRESEKQIPKVIHYCWFGRNPLPESAKKCIASWKEYLPDYEIKEWNESNFELNCCDYVKEAYQEKMWAFVSDYVRFKVLYEWGGIYFDTDVELIKPIYDILEQGSFMGSEASPIRKDGKEQILINPGLGLASVPQLDIYEEILSHYNNIHFIDAQGIQDITTVVTRVTNIMVAHGYNTEKKEKQRIGNIYVYPTDYFCPLNYYTGKLIITENTRSIHHYAETWHNLLEKKIENIQRYFSRKGKRNSLIAKAVICSLVVVNSTKKYGIFKTCTRILRKLNKKL
ncbi:MAG: glycosyl transferase [Clostridium sp.]|nr:glycosyl transferase [Clostridium sp.]